MPAELLPTFSANLAVFLREGGDYFASTATPWQKEMLAGYREAEKLAISIHHRSNIGQNRYVVAVVGLGNVGKSTLLNAIFGVDLAPKRNGPCTCLPIEFQRTEGSDFAIEALTDTTRFRRPKTRHPTAEAAQKRLQELADEGGEKVGVFDKVIVKVPLPFASPLLDRGVVIADTPGFGATGANGQGARHETLLSDYLTREVSQVFWVVRAMQGIGKADKVFWSTVLQDRCHDLVVTAAEDFDDRDKSRFRTRNVLEILGGPIGLRTHFLSGRDGWKARVEQNAQGLQSSGIAALVVRLSDFGDPKTRGELLNSEFAALMEDFTEWLGARQKTKPPHEQLAVAAPLALSAFRQKLERQPEAARYLFSSLLNF